MTPFRVRDPGCIHPDTYKYYVSSGSLGQVWQGLAEAFGPVRRGDVIPTLEIHGEQLWLRATSTGNPITVIRKRGWSRDAVTRLHEVLGFCEENQDGS